MSLQAGSLLKRLNKICLLIKEALKGFGFYFTADPGNLSFHVRRLLSVEVL